MSNQRLQLFPLTTRVENAALTIGGCNLTELAEKYGTPLYIYDAATMDAAVQEYHHALQEHYPGASGITYAGKAFLAVAIAQWTQRHGLWVDCTGLGEMRVAEAAGVPREHILIHGVNKSPAVLAAALAQAGTIVVDNLSELRRLVELSSPDFRGLGDLGSLNTPNLWLRFRPGRAVETHAHIQTGQEDSKFGMSAAEIAGAAQVCRQQGLPLSGLHFHLGSKFDDPAPLRQAIEDTLALAKEIPLPADWTLCIGGGWGVAYHEDDLPQPPVEDYIRFAAQAVVETCRRAGMSLPRLHVEPGRSLVARAGVAIYRVGTVKRTAHRRWLLLDGGMADNPRHALYGARYSALPVERPDRPNTGPAWLAGPYCESGDVLIENLPFPDVQEGELVAVPVSGAYHLSMASNYNGATRPAVVWLENGEARLIRARETP
ncbi:MAG: diaminopimelate decarboxylase, partial [Anaerolineae bacterium]